MPETKTWPLLFGIILSCCLLGCCYTTQPEVRRTKEVVPSCLTGPVPHIRKEWPDELYGLMRRELDRANRATPILHAHILEILPRLFPNEGYMRDRPACVSEYIELASRESFKRKPVEYSRLLLARVEAIDTFGGREAWESQNTFFPRLFELPDSELTEYRLMPGEAGLPPSKSLLRYRVLASLSDNKNSKEAQALALGRLTTSRDDYELVLLEFTLLRFFDHQSPESPEARSLMRALVAELRVRLAGPASPVSLELALQRILLIGEYGERFGMGVPARSLIQDVLRANGEMPVTRGIDGAAQNLAVTAYTTLGRIESPRDSGAVRARDVNEMWRKKFLQELPAMELSEADRRTRVQDLEAELAGLKFWASRCYVLRELARYAVPDNAERLFHAISGPIFRDGKVRNVKETHCRLDAAASIELIPEESRVALLIQVMNATIINDWIADMLRYAADEDPLEEDGMPGSTYPHHVLWDHVEWIERHRSLRDWITANQHGDLVTPFLNHVLKFHSSKDSAAEPEVGRSILRAWMDKIRAHERTNKHPSRRPYKEYYVGHILTLGKFAVRYGMRDEVLAFFDELEPIRQPEREGSMITKLSGGFPEPLGLVAYIINRASGP